MALIKHDTPGYEIYQPTSGGKAGKGRAKTSSIQVRRNNQMLTQFRYDVANPESRAIAIRNAKQYAENHYKANQPKPQPKPERREPRIMSVFGDATFKQELLEHIDHLARQHNLNWFEAIEESMEVLSHMMLDAYRKDTALSELYERAKQDAQQELIRKLKE